MIFAPTRLPGVFIVDIEKQEDTRGFFARTWCAEEFARHGLPDVLRQCSISFNRSKATLRGLHYQAEPHGESKLVRCTAGAIFDVAVDLRTNSPARGEWIGVELSALNRRMVFIPEGVAHGFQTLAPESEVVYQMSAAFVPGAARGVRWDDPAFGIAWPLSPSSISERDLGFPDFRT